LELSPGYKDELFGTAEDFARDFERTHRYEPPDQAAQSAAAVHAFAAAFARAQSLDPETVRSAIAETELETFYGPVKFDGTGRNIAKRMVPSAGRQTCGGVSGQTGHRRGRRAAPAASALA
jgi:branched-chain amino acid transport system substrate-binding protein